MLFLSVMDDGERYVALQGLYKAYSFMNAGVIFAILFAVDYSTIVGESQMFSIIVMSLLFLVVNIVYSVTIRKRV